MRKLPKIISQEEFEKILSSEKDKEYRLAFLLGFESGMRISEIVGLEKATSKCCGADLIEKRIEENGKKLKRFFCLKCEKMIEHKDLKRKNGEFDIMPLTKENIEPAQIRIVSGKGKKDRIVPRPKRLNETAINLLPIKKSRRALQWEITKLGKEILGKEITFHTLRHGFCSHLANKGRPLHEIQMLAGHANLATTGIYLHANPQKAIEGAQDVF